MVFHADLENEQLAKQRTSREWWFTPLLVHLDSSQPAGGKPPFLNCPLTAHLFSRFQILSEDNGAFLFIIASSQR